MIPADLLDQLREKDPELWERINRVYAMRYMRQIDDPQGLFGVLLDRILEFLTGKEKQSLIQGYLQEAIRARDGWGCQITSFGLPVIANVYNRRAYTTGRGDTEAEALGWAYLEAIEAIRQ